MLITVIVVETVFDTFLSSYCYATEAMLLQMGNNNTETTQESKEIWTRISSLAYDSLTDLRRANHLRLDWSIADGVAADGFHKLKER